MVINRFSVRHYTSTLRLGIPIAIGQLGVIVQGFADTVMVGHYSTEALAASAFVGNLFTLVTFLVMGYSYGLTPLVSSRVGRGEKREAGGLLKNALVANLLYGGLFLLVMTGLYFRLDLFGQPREILPLAAPYYLTILISMVFVILFNVLRQFTDGTTDTATGMWTLLGGNLLNILLNFLLIFGVGPFPELGLLGAGLATLISRAAMALCIVWRILSGPRYAPYRAGFLSVSLSRSQLRLVNAKSFPVSLQIGMETGSFTCSAVMAGWLGAVQLASYQIMVTVGTLGFLFYYSFAAAMSIRVAGFCGTQSWQEARRATSAGRNLLLVMATVAGAAFLLFGNSLVSLFTTDEGVVQTCLILLLPLTLYQYSDAMQICYAGALRGTGHVMPMMWIAAVSYLFVGIPAAYLLGFVACWGIIGIFLAFSAGLFTAAVLFYFTYRRYMRGVLSAG